MKKWIILPLEIFTLLALSACNSPGGTGAAAVTTGETASETETAGGTQAAAETGNVRLQAASTGDLSVQGQLALGTLQLEETDLAIDEALAAELLPLWQALQSLGNSEATAGAELSAVVNQIQDTMDPAQLQAIAAMELTEERLNTMLEEGELGFGGGNFRGGAFPGVSGPGGRGDGAGEGGGNFNFGRPPGGLPGGGPGGGGGILGGGPGGRANLSEDDIATRQAQFEEGDFASGDFAALFQGRILTGAVIRLLQEKTGETPEVTSGGLFNTVFTIVGEETGLSAEEIREQLSAETTLAEIVEANGGDLEAVRAALVEAFGQLPNADDFDPGQLADDWLGLGE